MLGELCYQGDYGPVPLGESDIRVMSSSLHAELQRVEDPHEFATAFVNWRENAPANTEINMWSAFYAVDYWRAYGTLDRLPYERLDSNG